MEQRGQCKLVCTFLLRQAAKPSGRVATEEDKVKRSDEIQCIYKPYKKVINMALKIKIKKCGISQRANKDILRDIRCGCSSSF